MKYAFVVFSIGLLVGAVPAADSLNCRWVGAWPCGPSGAVALDTERDLAFCADHNAKVCVLDVADPARPSALSSFVTGGYLGDIVYRANRLYVARGAYGFGVWDVANPSNPVPLGEIDTPGDAYGAAVAGSYAYVGDFDSGLRSTCRTLTT